jgi:raffinose/stachyose/melibiose transport system permease protein
MPMGIYLGTEFIKSIPDALVESARIDGATYLKIFISIIVPMAAPVAVTVAIMTVTGTWNEFMLINILTSSDALKSLPVGVQKFAGALSSDFGKQFAALVIGLVPMLVFYLTFRKEITKGVAAGAVKG